MAIGDPQDDARYGDMKPGLPLLQVPRTGSFFGGHLPLAPADSRQNQYLDTRPETQHQFQSAITPPVEAVPNPFNGLGFSEPQERAISPMRRGSAVAATLTLIGFENPSTLDVQWSAGTPLNMNQRSRIERYIRSVANDPNGNDGAFNTPTRGREASCDSGRRSSWTPDYRASGYRFVNQQGTRRRMDQQLSREDSPDDEDDDGYMLAMTCPAMVQIRLDDSEAVNSYYVEILRGVQQLALKQLLKEWIKVIEPKKQKNFPYKKEIRPRWWPEEAAYKEPDHIKVEDRVHLALGIIRYVQDPDEFNGEGLDKIEKAAQKEDLRFENDPEEKGKYRHQLLAAMFCLARAEQQIRTEGRDATEAISLPQVKKFEKPNKKRKKSGDRTKSFDNGGPSMNLMNVYDQDEKTPNGLLRPGTLKSQGERASTAPNTPNWSSRHATQDSGVCFQPPADQPQNTHLISYGHQYDQSVPMERAYSGYAEDGSNSSPESAYPSSTTSAGSMHMTLSYDANPPVSMGYSVPCHSMPTMPSQEHSMMSGMALGAHQPRVEQVFTAVTETEPRAWTATPASYMPSQPTYTTTPGFY